MREAHDLSFGKLTWYIIPKDAVQPCRGTPCSKRVVHSDDVARTLRWLSRPIICEEVLTDVSSENHVLLINDRNPVTDD